MAFHFPLMPRMYMALAREDRFPITDILRQTPPIPDTCQWAIFLRNHDELTLEMVTDSERDYLWQTYATDRRARINLGIRRRLAPLLERDRRRIELMNCLLLSMPGTPVIYYGDEIGMGDNVRLGDRDGVRTPMQWSPDRNGGFSRADWNALALPTIQDPLYGYETVNVEAQSRDPFSLLHWMRRMLTVRRSHAAFGRGALRFLYPKNRKVLAYLREHQDETILCVANVSRTPQAVELDLSEFTGRVPIELNGGSVFPPVGQFSYLLTLPPYGFYWFVLGKESEAPDWHTPAPEPLPDYVTLVLRDSLGTGLRQPEAGSLLDREALPAYLAKRRWFSAKDQKIESVHIAYTTPLPGGDRELLLAEIETKIGGAVQRWQMPLTVFWEDEPAAPLPNQLALSRVRRGRRVGLVTDAFALPSFALQVLKAMAERAEIETAEGRIVFQPMPGTDEVLAPKAEATVSWLSAEQSNSSLIVNDQVMLKIFRRVTTGEHPEAEMGRYLTAQGYANSPTLLGEVMRIDQDGERHELAVAQAFIRNQGDGWVWTLNMFKRAVDDLATHEAAVEARADNVEDCQTFTATIGRQLAAMHMVLARDTGDPAFKPRIATAGDVAHWIERAIRRVDRAFDIIGTLKPDNESDGTAIATLTQNKDALIAAARRLARTGEGGLVTRIHGDFHLGQVLVASGDAYIIDFEGEPARPLAERRAKMSPMVDVAGLMRSIDYAVATTLDPKTPTSAPLPEATRAKFVKRLRDGAQEAFLEAYRAGAGGLPGLDNMDLLNFFMLEKAAYELGYEAANRPAWLSIPLHGLHRLMGRILGEETRSVG
jgi:maltose alpha-D-glucosyltransferase/alpha-amylase